MIHFAKSRANDVVEQARELGVSISFRSSPRRSVLWQRSLVIG